MKELSLQEFENIRSFIKSHYGIHLQDEKRSLIYSRLRNVVQERGFKDFTAYFDFLMKEKSGDAIIQFIDKITTNHTFFMRESDHFDYFRDYVLPFIEQNAKDKDVRIWCAGCSSGEEPYTLQMIIQDYFSGKSGWNTEILATDISTQVLEKAVRGVYSNESLVAMPPQWLKKYFQKFDAENSVVKDEIKALITFRKFNLMEDRFPFKKQFQVIFCRNVMIYFDNETRDTVVQKYYDQTENGGYLFIGHSESLNHTSSKYKYILPAIYKKE